MIGEGLARRAITGVEMARDAGHSLAVAVAPSGRHIAADEVRERLETQPQRVWRLLAAHVTAEWLVGLLATALSIGFYIWYSQRGLTLAYGDAISHMNIARRVLADRQPGLGQLGSAWLPLNHILMLPLIWNTTLWRDGFAGAFPSMVAYVTGSVYMFRTGRLLFTSRSAGWVAALVFMLNPSLLYMQSTAMTEADLLCTAVVAIYYLLRWARDRHEADLVWAAGAIAAGTLIRYDGWALACVTALIVVYISWKREGRSAAEARALLFGCLAFAGCLSWVIYNWVIFHDPLDFFHGPYSAQTQQQEMSALGLLPTHNNSLLSAHVYWQVTLDTVGMPLALMAIGGLVVFILRFRGQMRTLPIYTTLIPFLFNWASLVRGVSIVLTPEVPVASISSYFNERYGMMMIPAVAIFVAALSAFLFNRRVMYTLALTLAVGIATLYPLLTTPYALEDPLIGFTANGQQHGQALGAWFAAHYHGGDVLIGKGPSESTIFYSGIADNAFILVGNEPLYVEAATHPQTLVTWIIVDTLSDEASGTRDNDPLWAPLHQHNEWRHYFVLRATIGGIQFYERIATPQADASSALASIPTVPQSDERRRGAVASAL